MLFLFAVVLEFKFQRFVASDEWLCPDIFINYVITSWNNRLKDVRISCSLECLRRVAAFKGLHWNKRIAACLLNRWYFYRYLFSLLWKFLEPRCNFTDSLGARSSSLKTPSQVSKHSFPPTSTAHAIPLVYINFLSDWMMTKGDLLLFSLDSKAGTVSVLDDDFLRPM